MNAKQWSAFIFLTFIWGASFLWIKIAVQEVSPLTVVTLRLFMALLALIVFLVIKKPGVPHGWRLWGVLMLQGLLSTAIPWLLITWAEKSIDSALATVLNATVPLFTIVIAHFFLTDDRVTSRRIVGLLIGLVGVFVLVHEELIASWSTEEGVVSLALLGQGAMLLASASYGISNVYARVKLRGTAPIVQAFYTMLLADAVMWIVTPVIEPGFTLPKKTLTWVAITWLGMLGAGVCYLVFYHLLHSIGPTRVAMVTYTVPVVGVTLGVVFLDEKLDWAMVIGTILIVSGVWHVNRK